MKNVRRFFGIHKGPTTWFAEYWSHWPNSVFFKVFDRLKKKWLWERLLLNKRISRLSLIFSKSGNVLTGTLMTSTQPIKLLTRKIPVFILLNNGEAFYRTPRVGPFKTLSANGWNKCVLKQCFPLIWMDSTRRQWKEWFPNYPPRGWLKESGTKGLEFVKTMKWIWGVVFWAFSPSMLHTLHGPCLAAPILSSIVSSR